MPRSRQFMTEAEVRALPASTDVVTAGRAFGLNRDQAYDLVKAGAFPVPALKVGHRWVVPVRPILVALGLEREQPEARSA